MRFNQISNVKNIFNKAGGQALPQSNKLELASILLTSFVADQYYSTASNQIKRLIELIDAIDDKKFIAKAAIFARNEFGMRSICHILIGELLNRVKNEVWLKHAISKVINRPDEITEITAYYLSLYKDVKYKKGLPAALRKGIKLALDKFDSYKLAKYKSENREIKLVDIFNLVHPKPNSNNQNLFSQLIKGTLKSTETWEAKLSQAGQAETQEEVDSLKKDAWIDLIENKKLGYFALLRNLRNIIIQAPEALESALRMLVNAEHIKRSKVLPFRFITAIDEISKLMNPESRLVINAINQALEISLSNVPVFNGRTLVALDVSGSMAGKPIDIGALFAAALIKSNNSDLILFSNNAQYFDYGTISDSLSTITNKIKSSAVYSSTNFHSIFLKVKSAYDRIIILSDMQAWVGSNTPAQALSNYKIKYKCNPYIYSIDLTGYGSLQFPEKNIYCIAGFSEKIFDLMVTCEQDQAVLIDRIESIEL